MNLRKFCWILGAAIMCVAIILQILEDIRSIGGLRFHLLYVAGPIVIIMGWAVMRSVSKSN